MFQGHCRQEFLWDFTKCACKCFDKWGNVMVFESFVHSTGKIVVDCGRLIWDESILLQSNNLELQQAIDQVEATITPYKYLLTLPGILPVVFDDLLLTTKWSFELLRQEMHSLDFSLAIPLLVVYRLLAHSIVILYRVYQNNDCMMLCVGLRLTQTPYAYLTLCSTTLGSRPRLPAYYFSGSDLTYVLC